MMGVSTTCQLFPALFDILALCSSPNDDQDDCHSVSSIVRDGILGQYGIESLLYKYGVDMHFGGEST